MAAGGDETRAESSWDSELGTPAEASPRRLPLQAQHTWARGLCLQCPGLARPPVGCTSKWPTSPGLGRCCAALGSVVAVVLFLLRFF